MEMNITGQLILMTLDSFEETDQFKILHSWLREKLEREEFSMNKECLMSQRLRTGIGQKPISFYGLTNSNQFSSKFYQTSPKTGTTKQEETPRLDWKYVGEFGIVEVSLHVHLKQHLPFQACWKIL